MASIGHIVVGMAAARVQEPARVPAWTSMVLWSAISLLPDADVIGFTLGVRYADQWGHRGATHSLVASIAAGILIGLAARFFRQPAVRTAIIATVVLVSHAVLDTMTDGGLGCALFWPFDLTRYFAPWRPIPVAPIGLGFLSPGGASIALIELVLFSPLLLFAVGRLWAPKTRIITGSLLAVWLASVWLITSTDRVREAAVGFVVREDTAYTTAFSDTAFGTVTRGQSKSDVSRLLGTPFGQTWVYTPKGQPFQSAETMSAAALPDECLAMRFVAGVLVTARHAAACERLGIRRGVSIREVERLLDTPQESCWQYTWSPGDRRHRIRMICFVNSSVESVVRRWN